MFLAKGPHRPSKKLAKKNLHGISFNPSKQHAMNTNLIIKCTECNKLRIVYAQKKMSARQVQAFKWVAHYLLFICGSSIKELVGPKNFKEFHIRQNLKSIDQVEMLYYSAGFTSCCSRWDKKRTSKLSCGTNKYPSCSDYVKKKK